MAISPPSDLILDVVRAADPVRRQAAVARLDAARPADGGAYASVAAEVAQRETAPAAHPAASAIASGSAVPAAPAPKNAADALVAFEGMALATMIAAALPDEDNAMFGTGASAGMWKTMLAQEIGAQMARAGGIGLAEQLASHPVFARDGTDAGALLTLNADRTAIAALDDPANT